MRQTPPAQPEAGAQPYAGAPEDDDVAEAPDDDEGDPVPVQCGGRTYALPAPLHQALAQTAQALEMHRQALAAGHQALQQQAQMHGENLADVGRLIALGDQIQHLHRQNWGALQQRNPAAAQQMLHQLFQMRQAHEMASQRFALKRQGQAMAQHQRQAAQVQQTHAELAQRLPGWSHQHAARLADFAADQGLTPDEIGALNDPRLIVLLHHAWRGHQAVQQKAAGQKLAQVQAVRPAIQVGGGGSAPNDPNRMSTNDWMRHRRGQLRKKGR